MSKQANWIRQVVAGTPGTGDITLGLSVIGFIKFQDVSFITDGTLVNYTIEDGNAREIGIGTYVAAGTLLQRSVIQATLDSGGVYIENPGTGLTLTSSAIVSCSAIANNFRGCVLRNSTSQSLPNNDFTATAIMNWDTEDIDTDGFHEGVTNPSRITIPVGVTRIECSAAIEIAGNTTGIRGIYLLKNGSPIDAVFMKAPNNQTSRQNVNFRVIGCVSGDYYEIRGLQDSGGALNTNTAASHNFHWFQLRVIE